MAAMANIATATPTPTPAFVPSVMFDMLELLQILKRDSSQGRWEIKSRIDDDGGVGGADW